MFNVVCLISYEVRVEPEHFPILNQRGATLPMLVCVQMCDQTFGIKGPVPATAAHEPALHITCLLGPV